MAKCGYESRTGCKVKKILEVMDCPYCKRKVPDKIRVFSVMGMDGKLFGIKPGEFEFVYED